MAPQHIELPIVSFICAALSLAPLPWQWRSGTIPTISIALWLFVSNLINGINSTIWLGNVNIVAKVWCDIATKTLLGANVALPASILCLCIHLERVSSVRQVSMGLAQKRRRQYIDLFVCFVIPMIYMAAHYVVQGHRFDIVENFGCRANTYISMASVFLIWIPPLTFCMGAFVLSGCAFRNFWIRRITFARHLQTNSSALTPSRYFRLMSMSLVLMFWVLAVTSFSMWFTMKSGLRPWISWEDVHWNFSRIGLFPERVIPRRDLISATIIWWTVPASTVSFFAFFAFGQDAVKEYRACYLWVRRNILRISDSSASLKQALPTYDSKAHAISLSPVKSILGENQRKFGATLLSPTSSSFTQYPWSPPPFTPPSSSSHFPSSPTETLIAVPRSKDTGSAADTQSISSFCSTSHY